MSRVIFENAISQILAEKEAKINAELSRVQTEVVAPKFAEFDNEKVMQINAENDRHALAISQIETQIESRKVAYENEVKLTIEQKIENENHFEAQIKVFKQFLE